MTGGRGDDTKEAALHSVNEFVNITIPQPGMALFDIRLRVHWRGFPMFVIG